MKKRLVNLEGLKTGKFKGIIVKSVDIPLREQLKTSGIIDKFKKGMDKNLPVFLREKGTTQDEIDEYKEKRLNAIVTVITFEVEIKGETRYYTEWFNIPVTGYKKSNIKKVKDLNELPDNTADWVGKTINSYPDANGFLKLIPE